MGGNMKHITKILCLTFGIILTVSTGCNRGPADERPQIALIPKGTTHEFWQSIHAGGREAAEEADVRLLWRGPLREDDRNAQIETVENMINLGVDAIVLAPLDNVALQTPVRQAVAAGIPVVIIDSDLEGDAHIAFVATDNRAAGERGGHHLAELLEESGRVIMLRYQEGSASTMHREQGFLDAMEQYPNITVVSANQYGGATTETAYQASENLLAPLHADGGLSIDGIFCPNESTTFGMLRALQDGGLAGSVHFVGFDSSDQLVHALQTGQLHGLVLQDPIRMGYLGIQTAVAALRDEPFESEIDTGSVVATPDNLSDETIRSLLGLDEE